MKYIVYLLAILALASPVLAQDTTVTELEISFNRTNCALLNVIGNDTARTGFDFGEVRKAGRQVLIRDRVLISGDTLFLGSRVINLAALVPVDVSSWRGGFKITMAKREDRPRSRRGGEPNRYAAFEKLSVPGGDFVRDNVLVVGSEAVIEGEVNGYVIALFGDVRLGSTAICQRDVFAIGGNIQKHRLARVYGVYQATDSWRQSGIHFRKRPSADKSAVSLDMEGSYNRVDGLTLMPGVTFRSEEKFVPKFYFKYGYGFTSKLSKYQLGAEQTLFDNNQIKIGGSVYRLTDTEDDWICDESENSIYAVLIREDFRDYYQAEGGNIYIDQSLGFIHNFRIEYSFETLSYMQAHPGLWSLFGGDKHFRDNFSSVTGPLPSSVITDYDKDEAVLEASYVLNTVEDERGEMARAGWVAGVDYLHSSSRLGSDFGYDRFALELRRFQPLTYMQNLNVRLLYGQATGNLPLHRLFYLGGIRTLRGYDIKQYFGTRAALANCEYVVDFPKSHIGLAILFDIGKTGWDSDFWSQGKWRGDVGVGVRILDGLRLELTRQISGDTDKLQPSVLIGRSF
jgi:hypothetical protein